MSAGLAFTNVKANILMPPITSLQLFLRNSKAEVSLSILLSNPNAAEPSSMFVR